MNRNSQVEPAVDDASTFTEFLNIVGSISQAMYFASHPEENDLYPVQLSMERDAQAQMSECLYAVLPAKLQEAYL